MAWHVLGGRKGRLSKCQTICLLSGAVELRVATINICFNSSCLSPPIPISPLPPHPPHFTSLSLLRRRAISEAFRDGGGMLGDDGAGGGGSSDSSDDDEAASLVAQGSGMALGSGGQSLELADKGCEPAQAAAATAGEAVGTSSSAAAWVGNGASFRSWLSSGNGGAK